MEGEARLALKLEAAELCIFAESVILFLILGSGWTSLLQIIPRSHLLQQIPHLLITLVCSPLDL
jgi:hypothetical protein